MTHTYTLNMPELCDLHDGDCTLDGIPEDLHSDLAQLPSQSSVEAASVWDGWVPDFPMAHRPQTHSEKAAYIRGEIGGHCPCEDVHPTQELLHRSTGHRITIHGDERSIRGEWNGHGLCLARRRLGAERACVPEWSSARHNGHRVATLAPNPRGPLSVEAQQTYINKLPGIVTGIAKGETNGWVLLGPTGCSKTTYVHAVLRDVATIEWAWYSEADADDARSAPDYNPFMAQLRGPKSTASLTGIRRIRVADWVDATHAFDFRAYGEPFSGTIPLTVEQITTPDPHRRLVVWLEEFDRATLNEAKRNLLFRLVDALYEAEGCLIVTGNSTVKELKAKFDPALVRRLLGESEDEGYVRWDMHARSKRKTETQ